MMYYIVSIITYDLLYIYILQYLMYIIYNIFSIIFDSILFQFYSSSILILF